MVRDKIINKMSYPVDFKCAVQMFNAPFSVLFIITDFTEIPQRSLLEI